MLFSLSFLLSLLILISLLASVCADFVNVSVHKNHSECDIYCVRVQIGLSTPTDLSSAVVVIGVRYTEMSTDHRCMALLFFSPPPHRRGVTLGHFPLPVPRGPHRTPRDLSCLPAPSMCRPRKRAVYRVSFVTRLPTALVRLGGRLASCGRCSPNGHVTMCLRSC